LADRPTDLIHAHALALVDLCHRPSDCRHITVEQGFSVNFVVDFERQRDCSRLVVDRKDFSFTGFVETV